MTTLCRCGALLCIVVLTGCAAELGGTFGYGTAPGGAVGSGRIATSTSVSKIMLGTELEGRASGAGSRWTTGISAGYRSNPEQKPWAWGGEIHADVGTVVREGSFFPQGDFYTGLTAASMLWVSRGHRGADMNTSTWAIASGIELVPFVRGRVTWIHVPDLDRQLDVTLGFAIRLRLVSDYVSFD